LARERWGGRLSSALTPIPGNTAISRLYYLVRRTFHDPDARSKRIVESAITVLIIVSIGLLIVENLPSLPEIAARWLHLIDRFILGIFALELLLRVATVEPRARHLFVLSPTARVWEELKGRVVFLMRPLVFIDLLTVLTLFPGLRALRAIRLLRLLRSMRLFRYADPLRAGVAAIRDNSLVYAIAFAVLLLSVFFGGVTMYFAEIGNEDSKIDHIGDAFWWALVTITTVGYGDVTPSSGVGRAIASMLMVAGLFCIATFAGVVSHTLFVNMTHIRKEQLRMSTRIGHIVICGYDSIMQPLLESLAEEFPSTEEPMVIFAPEQPTLDLPENFTWIPGDPSKENELDKVRLDHARAVIVTGRYDGRTSSAVDAVTLLTIFTIRSYMAKKEAEGQKRKIPLQVVAEILDPVNENHALKSGADEVVQTARLGLSILAHTVAMPGTGTALGMVASGSTQNLFVGSIPSDLDPFPGNFGELVDHLKKEYDVLVLGIQHADAENVLLNPKHNQRISRNVNVVYLGSDPFLGDHPGHRWKPGKL